ncbi:Coiled-coil domain-containing protein 113 [Vespula maculifrons]|uniref:Cilia- and flagella-associated protein 263 n=1 Tax=Vespula maculifrons TaxID=7453 RepID=A0ABD2CWG8_VESMC
MRIKIQDGPKEFLAHHVLCAEIDAVSVSDTSKINCPKITGHGTSSYQTSSPTSSNISVRDRGSPSIWSMQSGIRRGMLDPMLRRLRITIAQRMELMQNEIIEFKNKLMLLERTGKKEKNKLNAEIEGLEICIREIKETKDRFENDIIIGGVDRITGKIPAETVIKFIKNSLKSMEKTIERIRLKNTVIKSQIIKANKQLIQREQLGEDLRPVDFYQLRIQRDEYRKRIRQCAVYILQIKKVIGHYNTALTKHKRKLGHLTNEFNSIVTEINSNKLQAKDLELKCLMNKTEIKFAEKQVELLKTLMDDYEVPTILDLVKLKKELRTLEKTFTNLKRYVNVEEII